MAHFFHQAASLALSTAGCSASSNYTLICIWYPKKILFATAAVKTTLLLITETLTAYNKIIVDCVKSALYVSS